MYCVDRGGRGHGNRETDSHTEMERCWGIQGRQSVFFLWAPERDQCHLQTKPHLLWLSPVKYSICQCHGPGVSPRWAASRVCWLCHSPIYGRHWQHHHVPNVPLVCSCSTLLSRTLMFFLPLSSISLSACSASWLHRNQQLLSGSTWDFLCRAKPKLCGWIWGLWTITSCPYLEGVFFCKKCCFVFCICVRSINSWHRSGLQLSCVSSNPISSQCLFRSRAGMVHRGWKFQSPFYHFPYHYSIRPPFLSNLSPEREWSG